MVKKYNAFEPQLVFAERKESAVALTNDQKLSLYKKSQKSGISTDILEEVYRRGYVIWNESFGQTADQFAFDRVNSFIAGGFAADLDEDLRKWFGSGPEGGWKRYNSKGEAIGPCGAKEPGEPKPKCMSNEKAASLTKKQRAAAVSAKRRHDPNPDRKGKPINVSNFGKGKISEMTDINEENAPTNPALWSRAKTMAKQKFDVYPSAYANGWASKWYKSKGGGWKSVKEEVEVDEACWTGYKKVGMKEKGGRTVPNCVPVKEDENLDKVNQITKDLKSITNKDKNLPHVDDGAPEMFKIGKKPIKENEEARSKDMTNPSSRFVGSNELVDVYKKMTPGYSVKEIIKKIVKEAIEESNLRAKHKSPSGGLTQAGRDYYNRTAGANLQAPVTTEPSKLKKGSKAANRRKSFCARMGGMKKRLTSAKTANDPDSRINKALRKWNC